MPFQRIGIAGLGVIGRTVARKLAGGIPGLTLSAIATRNSCEGGRLARLRRHRVPSDRA